MNAITNPADFRTETALAGARDLAELIERERAATVLEDQLVEKETRLIEHERDWLRAQNWPRFRLLHYSLDPATDHEQIIEALDGMARSGMYWEGAEGREIIAKWRGIANEAEARFQEFHASTGLEELTRECDDATEAVIVARNLILQYPAKTPEDFALKAAWLEERFVNGRAGWGDDCGRMLLASFVGFDNACPQLFPA